MSAEEVLRWAAAEFGDGLCLTCSWQRQSSVLIHMLSELDLDVDIVELDTLVLFPETYETRERLVERYGLELTSFRPLDPPDRLWETKPDECCHIRKVEPLERALSGYDAWITGIRREQSPSRAGARRVEWSGRYGFSKEDRDTNIERIGWVASRLTRHGAAVIVSAISPYRETRQKARELVEQHGAFVEVFVDASVEECARRDVKGLYEKAFRGEIKEFTGVSDPYEPPASPELCIESEREEPHESATRILDVLEERGLIPAEVTA